TAIQAQDFFFRKIVRDNGAAIGKIAEQIQQSLEACSDDQFAAERALLSTALDDAQGMLGTLIGYLTSAQEDLNQVYKVGQHAVTLLMSMGDVLIGWLLLRHAEIAQQALDNGASGRDKAFYEGKVASVRFFAKNVLPELKSRRTIIEAADNELME